MTDTVDKATRSRMMGGIKGKDTKPEIAVRKMLFQLGFRYRLHDLRLPGKPDLVLPRFKTVIFVHGCFWHAHDDCHLFRIPHSRGQFWADKLGQNVARDKLNIDRLLGTSWRVGVVWECALKGRWKIDREKLAEFVAAFINNDEQKFAEFRGVGYQKRAGHIK